VSSTGIAARSPGQARFSSLAFHLGIGALMTHELDAVANHEWRVLPLIRVLSDNAAMPLFIALHVPLFAGLLALIASPREQTRRRTRFALAVFLVVHAGLHVLYRGHPAYEFSSLLSGVLIFGGAVCGAVYLMIGTRTDEHRLNLSRRQVT